ncbi:hypothetical protein LTS18_012457, partial [Coniosporium uncinatum]
STRIVNKFLSIPYAAPVQRFATPSPPPSSKDDKAADKLPPACPQNGGVGFGAPDISESEDCLYLNVFSPASNLTSPDTSGRTVMVWFFGGGMQFGTASVPTYDGTNFSANHDVIIVAPNYRTNGKYAVFGFPGEVPGVPVSERNLGLLDQKVALRWVQDNIQTFGGDPKKVTIFGESAGGRSVDFHLQSYPKNPPF